MKSLVRTFLDTLGRPFGLKCMQGGEGALLYQHDYGKGGYEEYRRLQIFHNKRKFEKVWADEQTLDGIADYLKQRNAPIVRGLCHGARNGWEVSRFGDLLHCPVTGTDISETAASVPNMVQWDFHETREDWLGQFSFIYTNSLDQAFDPERALAAWTDQLADDGLIFIEHTMRHSAEGASEMDPFGAHPMLMPYLIFEWGRGRYSLADILHFDNIEKRDVGAGIDKVWVFVIEKSSGTARSA